MRSKLLTLAAAISIVLIPASAAAASYTVQPGDTLSGIADGNNVSLTQIESANTQIQNYDLIFPGQVINIPDGNQTTTAAYVPQPTSVSDDSYMAYIFSHESGNNPYAINAISGACGLGQALPCGKLLNACGSLSNVSCQVQFFNNYAVARYGSSSNAYAFWQAHRWW